MKLLVKRGEVTPAQFLAVETYGCELVHTDEPFAVTNGLSAVGFVDEETLSYFDPSDPESVASVNAAAKLRPRNLTVQEILDDVKLQESSHGVGPAPAEIINDDLLAGYQVDEDGLPILDGEGNMIPLSDHKSSNLEMEL